MRKEIERAGGPAGYRVEMDFSNVAPNRDKATKAREETEAKKKRVVCRGGESGLRERYCRRGDIHEPRGLYAD